MKTTVNYPAPEAAPAAHNDEPFRLQGEPFEVKRRAHRARTGEVLDLVLDLVEYWNADQRFASPKTRRNFDSWLKALRRIARGEQNNAAVGKLSSLQTMQTVRLCEAAMGATDESATPSAPGRATGSAHPSGARVMLKFEGVVELARLHGLFADLLGQSNESDLNRKSRSTFARVLKRCEGQVFSGSIRLSSTGVGHGRKYVFEAI